MLYNDLIGFKLSSMVRATLSNTLYYPFHLHKDIIEIICVINGSVKISDSALDYQLNYGDIYIFNANDPHRISSDNTDSIILTIHIDLNYYKKLHVGLDKVYFVCDSFINENQYPEDLQYLRFLMAKLFFEYSQESPSSIQTQNITTTLLAFLLEQFQYYAYKKRTTGSYEIVRRSHDSSNEQYFKRIYRIVDYIYENFRHKIKLKDIAENEFLSESYLCTYIQKTAGVSFSQLVSLARCEEVERLLCSTKKSIDTIASEVGFANRKHLATHFNRWFSKTPSQYRNSIKADLNGQSKTSFQTFDYELAKLILEGYLNGY